MSGDLNVILVVVDALRVDRVGAFESSRDYSLTPTIDEIAASSFCFKNAFSCSNATDASITSIHTGQYPLTSVYRHADRVTNTERAKIESLHTLPEILSEAGWNTVSVAPSLGRWHTKGFQTYLRPTQDVDPWLRNLRATVAAISSQLAQLGERGYNVVRSAHEAAMGRDQSAEKDNRTNFHQLLNNVDEKPFYGFVRMLDTHTPYTPPEPLVDRLLSEHEYPNGDLEQILNNAPEGKFLSNSDTSWLTDRDFEEGVGRIIARYDAAVAVADHKIALFRQELRERNLWDDTVLIICSDHGESLLEHGILADHHGLYDQTIHVPLLIRIPDKCGGSIDEFVQLPDIAPTVVDLLDVGSMSGIYGRSLMPLIGGDGSWQSRKYVFADEAYAQRRRAVRSDQWKLIEHTSDETLPSDGLTCRYCGTTHGPPPELFDVNTDPSETSNIADSHSNIVDRLREEYENFIESQPEIDHVDAGINYNDEDMILEQLEDLGYR